jgi:hypothetical protein
MAGRRRREETRGEELQLLVNLSMEGDNLKECGVSLRTALFSTVAIFASGAVSVHSLYIQTDGH